VRFVDFLTPVGETFLFRGPPPAAALEVLEFFDNMLMEEESETLI
jgi:hypothetical protein